MHSTQKYIDKAILLCIIMIILSFTALLFYFLALRIGYIAKENQTYNRYISCVLSLPANKRTQAKIDSCWVEVQKDTGIHVKRYDQ